MNLSKTRNAILALIITNIIWGAAPPIFKWSLQDIGPFTLAFLRFAIATLLVLPFAIGRMKIRGKDFTTIFAASFLGITINISFFFQGLKFAPSINSTIIGSAGPVFLVLFSLFILHERLKKKLVFGSLLGLIGVILIIARPLISHGTDLSVIGNIFYLAATIGSLGQTILGRKIMQKYDAITIAFWSFLIGMLSFTPSFFDEVRMQGFLPHLTYQGIIGIIFGAYFCSALAYFLYYYALKNLLACEAGMFTYLDPIVTIIIAIPLLGEVPDSMYLIGALMVFLGIYVAEGRIHYHPFHMLLKSKT